MPEALGGGGRSPHGAELAVPDALGGGGRFPQKAGTRGPGRTSGDVARFTEARVERSIAKGLATGAGEGATGGGAGGAGGAGARPSRGNGI